MAGEYLPKFQTARIANGPHAESQERIDHKCAIAGVYDPNGDPVSIMYTLLQNMNNRGQEGSEMAVEKRNGRFDVRGGRGWVSQAYTSNDLIQLQKDSPLIAVGQNRYSTSGDLTTLQPLVSGFHGFSAERILFHAPLRIFEIMGKKGALVHNGNLTNAIDLRAKLPKDLQKLAPNDTGVAFLHMLHNTKKTWEERIIHMVEQCEGAFNFVIAADGKLFGYRDPWGFRPLSIGRFPSSGINEKYGYVFASENGPFQSANVEFLRDVTPGEGIVIDPQADNPVQTFFVDERTDVVQLAQCIFELVYFASPDSVIFGKPVSQIRRALGGVLARKDAARGFLPDVIVPVQHSGMIFAEGYAAEMIYQLLADPAKFGLDSQNTEMLAQKAASLQTQTGLVANIYANGRSFIAPDGRQGINLTKHRADMSVFSGKRKKVIIDDSIVRGGASRRVKDLLQRVSSEKEETHMRFGYGVRHPCFMGVDFSTYDELIIPRVGEDGLKNALGVDSVDIVTSLELLEVVIGPDKIMDLKRQFGDDEIVLYQRAGYCGACTTKNPSYAVNVDGVFRKAMN